MENAFYFTLKVLCVREIFKFLSRLFGHVEKGLVKKLGFKIYDVIYWETNNFLKNHTQNVVEKLVPDLFVNVEPISGSTV